MASRTAQTAALAARIKQRQAAEPVLDVQVSDERLEQVAAALAPAAVRVADRRRQADLAARFREWAAINCGGVPATGPIPRALLQQWQLAQPFRSTRSEG